ncbi:hypothetical protein FHG87_008575 [Trinorchestia longiramus]|nr:hypothetical protein FHG87_008575 [Trinorchestia longiramus]
MKTAVIFALMVGVAVAQLSGPAVGPGGPGPSAGGPGPSVGGAAGPAAGGAAPRTGNPWGPRAYGMGLNNPWALPPNPFMMQRAVALVNQVPGALVRVDVDGSISITNQFGQEVDIVDNFGNEISEMFD